MNSDALFGMALGLQAPWIVTDVSFQADEPTGRELHLRIGFTSGSKFKDDVGAQCSVHDTVQRQWQHLNFFEHHCFLHCKVPRIVDADRKLTRLEG